MNSVDAFCRLGLQIRHVFYFAVASSSWKSRNSEKIFTSQVDFAHGSVTLGNVVNLSLQKDVFWVVSNGGNMRIVAFFLSAVLFGQTGSASVVTTQLASTNVSSFTSNNLAFGGGFGATLPPTVALSSTVTPANPPIAGVSTASTTVAAFDAFNGLDSNIFTWTVTTTSATVDVIRFSLVPIVPLTTDFRFVQTPPVVVPAGWTRFALNAYEISFVSTTGEKAPGTFAFDFIVDARDAAGPGGPFTLGSFTVNMAAQNPEPGSLALCGLASVIAGGLGWRRGRKVTSVAVDERPSLEI